MIVRAWWRAQAWLAGRPTVAWLTLAGATALAAWGAGMPPAPRAIVASAVAGLLLVAAGANGLAGLLAGASALLLAIGVAGAAGGGVATGAAVAALAGLVLAPVSGLLRGGRDPARAQHAAGRATGLAWQALHFPVLGALVAGDRAAVAAALALGVAVSLPLVALAIAPSAHPLTPVPVPAEPAGRSRRPGPLLLVAALVLALPHDLRPAAPGRIVLPDQAPLLLGLALLWGGLTLRPLAALAALAGMATGLLALDAARAAGAIDPLVFAIGQIVPLLLWHLRGSPGASRTPAFTALGFVAIAGFVAPAWLAALAGAAGVATALALLPEPRRGGAGDALSSARRAFAGLDPSWRCYGLAKLALDPLYRRLALDPRPWGRVLDLGCGPGLAATLAAARADATAYLGIDLDLDKLLVARRALARAGRRLDDAWRLVHARLPSAPAPEGRFDTVLLLDVLHYAPVEVQRAMLAQARALLAVGGVLLLRDGLADAAGDAGRVGLGERFTTALGLNPSGRLHFLDQPALRALLADAGLVVAASEPCGGENRLWTLTPAPIPG